MGEHLVVAEVVPDLDGMAGRGLHWMARWAVDGSACQSFDGSAEQAPHSAWAAQNDADGLVDLYEAQHGLFPVVQSVQHG